MAEGAAAYWAAMDPYPRTTPADTRLHPFWAHLAEGRLTTTRCRGCGHVPWPPRVVCPACLGDDLEWVDLPTQGTVAGYVVQESGLPPGFGDWAIFALVDVGAVRLLSRLVGCQPSQVHVGMPVVLVPWEVPGAPGQPHRLLPAFTPAGGPAGLGRASPCSQTGSSHP